MTDDELVERFFPCIDSPYCHGRTHSLMCPADKRGHASSFAAAVREAVLKRVRVCGKCEGSGGIVSGVNLMPCPTCHGRGVTESET